MAGDLPKNADDPRLANWYHTVDLGNRLVSRGFNDHRGIVDQTGLPASLAGKTALDVGTFDGFWAFELERRGAEKVTAIDIARIGDFDWLPRVEAQLGPDADRTSHFELAHRMRGSRVDRRILSVYDLSPETVGTFDVVFCGDVLLHLFNPLLALINIFSVTKEMAIVFTSVDQEIERLEAGKPWLSFGNREFEASLGTSNTYWFLSTKALSEMMEYAGFAVTAPCGRFGIPPTGIATTSVVGYRDAAAAARAGVGAAPRREPPPLEERPDAPAIDEESIGGLKEQLRRERRARADAVRERDVAIRLAKADREWREALMRSRLGRLSQAYRRVTSPFRRERT